MSNFLTATYPFAADYNLDDLSDNEQTIPLLLLQVTGWPDRRQSWERCWALPLSTGVLFQTVLTGVFSTTHPTSIRSHLVSAPPSVSAGAKQKADEMRASQKASRTRDKEE
ncbi:hypothetical protein I350_08214 [Cryptococcus amylolentus CBS 6273]|uniref:Uncharacterized protein n=1 Tax=Cryptococcus amylolentus CBS 6273 TaxID=1296118 RepID=A0A1E3J8N9_9TREE|nr:hypothetical protein I350_08214 [Cryptococcus amylolentus CBS 6273]